MLREVTPDFDLLSSYSNNKNNNKIRKEVVYLKQPQVVTWRSSIAAFWSQDPFTLLKINENSQRPFIYMGYI